MLVSDSSSPVKALRWCLWLLGIALILYLWPSFKFGQPIWQAASEQSIPHLFLALIPLVVAGATAFRLKRTDGVTFWSLFFLNGTLYGLIFLILFQGRVPYSRFVLPVTFFLSVIVQLFGLFVLYRLPKRWMSMLLAATYAAGMVLLGIVTLNPADILGISFRLFGGSYDSLQASLFHSTPPKKVEQYLNSAFYDIRADVFKNYFPVPEVRGGGMVSMDEGILLITGDGKFYLIKRNGGFNDLEIETLGIVAPFNFQAFVNAVPVEVFTKWFRVAGINLQRTPAGIRLWVSHHYWKDVEKKFFVRLSSIEGTLDELRRGDPQLKWKTVFESTPGLGFRDNPPSGNAFAGLQIGGRIQILDEEHLLLSIGDHEFDGWNSKVAYPQDRSASYGKILKIHTETGAAEIFTWGHRNPQGLFIAEDGNIWSTEHGPQGGDELNLIREGNNYGWPKVILGTEYLHKEWPFNEHQGDHQGYEYPVYAWLPSIGISNLTQVKSPLFPIWRDNLLVASMEQKNVYRVKLKDGHVILVEPIAVGERIRDIIEDRDGKIFFWTDDGHIMVLNPIIGGERTGEMLMAQCKACHTFDETGQHLVGPNLAGVFNRAIGTAPNFNYSTAISALKGTWDEKTLNAFLANPQGYVPGTSMVIAGLQSEAERKTLIEYLRGR